MYKAKHVVSLDYLIVRFVINTKTKGEMKMKKLALLFVVAFIVGFMAAPAGAGPLDRAFTNRVTDFQTFALDAEGNFKSVLCSHGQQVTMGEVVRETYNCKFDGGQGLGDAVLPKKAMRWDYDSTSGLGPDANFGIYGPYRWYSDIYDILTEDLLCWMYTDDWTTVITPSGNVNATVVYTPPLFEGSECPPAP